MFATLSKLPRQAFELGAYTLNALTGNVYLRFLGLRTAAERALNANNETEAQYLVLELLRLADQFKDDWHYGNAVHQGNLILGEIALREKDLQKTAEFMLLASATPGSPQLNSFGPNMNLAKLFMESGGDSAIVLDYLDRCGIFWKTGAAQIEKWKQEIRDGAIPEFGANLYY